ncbi:hypothetical protein M0805_000901 [Coniferiporia weirii]|nr:hypothetical protein M0805_000901 [Coniferiporia weirii]
MMKDQKARATRSISASEIARNVRYFETWSSFHGCEQVDFSDLPDALRKDVFSVFDVTDKLPKSLVDKSSRSFTRLSKLAPDLHKFLIKAHTKMPALFSDNPDTEKQELLLAELSTVFLAWSQLVRMKRTKERWSEADFAANVYNVLRSPAVRESSYRTQCSIHLPQYRTNLEPSAQALRVLKTQTIVPDGAIFVRASEVKSLSSARGSAYKRINANTSTKQICGPETERAFRYQATPCTQPQSSPCFEFVSSFWEDKKPGCEMLEHGYRQNRMASAAALRHLHALYVNVPVFGLLWTDGKVKAHVDWCLRDGKHPSIFSAAYPAVSHPELDFSDFHEWDLYKPADILSVFLLVRNLDIWTANTFRKRVEDGVNALTKAVVEDGRPYVPWKGIPQKATVLRTTSYSNSENTPPTSASISPFPTPLVRPKRAAAGATGRTRRL